MRLVSHRLPLGGRSQGLMRGLGVTSEPLHWPCEECGGSYRGESRGVPRVMRSQGVARGILWGVDRGWVVQGYLNYKKRST